MSLHLAAKHIAGKGRGPDDSLVHMSKGEIKSLQDLAKANGGSLTINPATGLPEAGFLSSILPMLAGLALGPAGVGIFGSALTAGMGVGAATGLATGSLRKGLMAGFGAYGGAGLGQGLAAAGAPPIDVGSISSSAGNTAASAVTPVTAVPMTSPMGISQSAADIGNEYAREQASQNAIAKQLAAPTPTAPLTASDKFAQMGRGLGNLGSDVGNKAFMGTAASPGVPQTGVGGGAGLFKLGSAALAPAVLQEPMMPKIDNKPNPYEYSYDYQTGQYGRQDPGYRDSLDPSPGVPMQMASGGMSSYNLGDYSDGGRLLKGPGDGVSDSIPATIANKRPARLADGEFVVPARIVSELGNGSTEAGARKLYAMMDRVQKSRGKTVGKGKIAANSRADKHLPA